MNRLRDRIMAAELLLSAAVDCPPVLKKADVAWCGPGLGGADWRE
jgi:hypothetical protein